jgi:2-succinyl-6-hydroxy-2,4-cyclohexadiene-1-carboxylate synthase
VLVHGFTQTGRSWRTVADTLVASGHQVVVVDAPGHARSSAVAADLWHGAELLADAGGRAVYVGYSMGGRLCLHLALAHPGVATGLVLVSATAGIEDEAERVARRRADDALAARIEAEGVVAFLADWLAQPMFAGVPADAAGLDDRRRNTPTGLASSLRLAGTGSQEPLWPRLATIDVPTLVMAGQRDPKFSAVAARLVATIGANASLAVVEGAGHAVAWERPAPFVQALEAFLTTLRRGR